MSEMGTLGRVAIQGADLLQAVRQPLSGSRFFDYLDKLGFVAPAEFSSAPMIADARQIVDDAFRDVETRYLLLREAADQDRTTTAESLQLLAACAQVVTGLAVLGQALGTVAAAVPGIGSGAVAGFTAQFAQRVVTDALKRHLIGGPLWTALAVLGLVRHRRFEGASLLAYEVPHGRWTMDFARIGAFLKSPVDSLSGQLGWGSGSFDYQPLFQSLQGLLLGELNALRSQRPIPSGSRAGSLDALPRRRVEPAGATAAGLRFLAGAARGGPRPPLVHRPPMAAR